MRKSLLFALIILSNWLSTVNAQDIHFSQYWMSPIQLSPAMTGAHNGEFRAGFNYRNQWFTLGTSSTFQKPTFVTYSFSFEYNLLKDRLHPDKFSVGFLFFGDRAGDGALTTTSLLASIAYHKAIDRYGRNHLGFGLQAGFVQKRLFVNDLLFETQLDVVNLAFDVTRWHGETVVQGGNYEPISYPDANLGLLWTSEPRKRFRYYLSFGMFHIARPVETFYPATSGTITDENRLDHRYSFNGGFEVDITDRIKIAPSFLFQTQSKAREIDLGAAIIGEVSPDIDLFFGIWSRMDFDTEFDAIYPVIGIDLKNTGVKAGLSYDVNLSDLRISTNAHGALEISLLYIHNSEKWNIRNDHYCPGF